MAQLGARPKRYVLIDWLMLFLLFIPLSAEQAHIIALETSLWKSSTATANIHAKGSNDKRERERERDTQGQARCNHPGANKNGRVKGIP